MIEKPLQSDLMSHLGSTLQSPALKMGYSGMSPLTRFPSNPFSMLVEMPKPMLGSALYASSPSLLFGPMGKSLQKPYFISGT